MKTKGIVVISVVLVSIITTLVFTIPLFKQEDIRVRFIHITSDEDFLKYNLPGSGTADNPYVIESFSLGFDQKNIKDYSPLLYLSNISKHVIVRNNVFNGSHIGILVNDVNSSTVIIEDNYFISQKQCVNGVCFNSFYGIKIVDSNNITIQQNEFKESNYEGFIYGIFFERSFNIEITGNIISSFYAIYALESFYFRIEGNYYFESVDIYFERCSYFEIRNNIHNYIFRFKVKFSSFVNFENNQILGYNNSFGLILDNTFDVNISNNTFYQNIVAITAYDAYQGKIINNTFELNTNYAIEFIGETTYFEVYRNRFLNNNLNSTMFTQVLDDGFDNLWNSEDTLEGNYWSDIGTDSYYIIDGKAESIDSYPLKSPKI